MFRVALAAIVLGSLALTRPIQAQDTFEEWKNQQKEEYQSFKDERDKEFLKFLKEEWKFVESYGGQDLYSDPKPDRLPEADKSGKDTDMGKGSPKVQIPDDAGREPTPQPDDDTRRSETPGLEPEPESEREEETSVTEKPEPSPEAEKKEQASTANFQQVNLAFYKSQTQWKYDPAMKIDFSATGKKKQEKEIGEFWKKISQTRYGPLLEQCKQRKEDLQLNDWGYTLMLYNLGGSIYGDKTPEQRLFTWFMLTKSGYNARVGYNEDALRILLPVKNGLFNTSYYTIDGTKYYSVRLEPEDEKSPSLYTYDGSYPDAEESIDMRFYNSPRFEQNYKEKSLEFSYNGNNHTLNVPYNPNLLDFYEQYPQTDLGVYFAAPMNQQTSRRLLEQLKPLIEDKNEAQAVNLILRFVQTAFEYKVDEEQFGREKYMLPVETIYYPYSDCEDRCFLFAYLVRNLTNLEVVGLKYSGHLATAVKFSKHPGGDSIKWQGNTYTVADPTYVNADIGMTMTKYKDKKPEVVEVP